MSMSPAAVYRYFENRDALLVDLVVDAYNEFADFIVASAPPTAPAADQLTAVLNAARGWALAHANAYRLIFQTAVGSGQEPGTERTRSAASRSMAAIVTALAAASAEPDQPSATTHQALPSPLDTAVAEWSASAGFSSYPPQVLGLALRSWTRLHGIISLELGGHLGATGLDPALLYDAEVADIRRAATSAS